MFEDFELMKKIALDSNQLIILDALKKKNINQIHLEKKRICYSDAFNEIINHPHEFSIRMKEMLLEKLY